MQTVLLLTALSRCVSASPRAQQPPRPGYRAGQCRRRADCAAESAAAGSDDALSRGSFTARDTRSSTVAVGRACRGWRIAARARIDRRDGEDRRRLARRGFRSVFVVSSGDAVLRSERDDVERELRPARRAADARQGCPLLAPGNHDTTTRLPETRARARSHETRPPGCRTDAA
jgi:hypothetical protein